MTRLVKPTAKEVGAPPGTLVHVGERKTDRTRIRVLDYDEEGYREEEVETPADCAPFAEHATVTWVDVEGLHEVERLRELGDVFGLHPLVLEDVLDTGQRPKMEDYDGYVYIVARVFTYADGLEAEQVGIIILPHMVITFREGGHDVFEPVRARIRGAKGRMRSLGVDFLAYALLDAVVDSYFTVLEAMGDKIEEVEEELLRDPSQSNLHGIHALKREAAVLRKSVWPLRDVMNGLMSRGAEWLAPSNAFYIRDLYDHTIGVAETIETYRDLLAGMLDIYLSSVSNRMNEVMKVLTVIATVFIPLTFLAGVYGMNFKFMPELQSPWGYPAVWAVMLAAAGAMLHYFWRKKWL